MAEPDANRVRRVEVRGSDQGGNRLSSLRQVEGQVLTCCYGVRFRCMIFVHKLRTHRWIRPLTSRLHSNSRHHAPRVVSLAAPPISARGQGLDAIRVPSALASAGSRHRQGACTGERGLYSRVEYRFRDYINIHDITDFGRMGDVELNSTGEHSHHAPFAMSRIWKNLRAHLACTAVLVFYRDKSAENSSVCQRSTPDRSFLIAFVLGLGSISR